MTTRKPLQKRGIITRDKIRTAGIKLFSDIGYYNINSKDIAKEAGVAIGSFYAYYKDKKELFIDILNEFKRIKFEAVYYCNDKSQDIEIDDLSNDKFKLLMLSIKKFVANLINSSKNYPSQFYIEMLHLSYRDPEIKKEYRIYSIEETNHLKATFSNFPVNFTENQVAKISSVIQKIIDSFMLLILDKENTNIVKPLIATFENAIFKVIENEITEISSSLFI